VLRGVVVVDDGEVMWTRSPALAVAVARTLNGEEEEAGHVEDPSPLSTYSVSRAWPTPERFFVVAPEPTRSNPGKFGGGLLASSPHEEIAREVAAVLNRMDPRKRPRVTRGFGWF
jgi:hypothetical protein